MEEDPKDEGASDLDWLKKHMSKDVDTAGRAFEQSDDEEDVQQKVRVVVLLSAYCSPPTPGQRAKRRR